MTMSPNRHHAHPLAGGRLVGLYVLFVVGVAVLATLLQHTA
jgi:hypothetical protein